MGEYAVILADPPWHYNSRNAVRGRAFSAGGAAEHYDLMKTPEICALPIADLAADNCALLMWATCPRLPDAFKVMEAWGFKYSTVAFTWVKTYPKAGTPYFGPGYYSRSNIELILLGVKGRMPPVDKGVNQVILEPHPRGEDSKIIHSRKPDEARQRIKRLFGAACPLTEQPRRYIELFSREVAPGWDAMGNQHPTNPVELLPEAV